jgi:hypothetical protein
MVMTVEPGFGGQSFMADVAREKVLAARDYLAHKPVDAEVHVDGGVNRETAEIVGGLGADVVVVGSVLWVKGHDMGREMRLVRALATGATSTAQRRRPPTPRTAGSASRACRWRRPGGSWPRSRRRHPSAHPPWRRPDQRTGSATTAARAAAAGR